MIKDMNIDALDRQGYTIVPGFLDREVTRRVRQHTDSLISAGHGSARNGRHTLRHPIPGAIMAELVNNPALLGLANQCLQARELRLLEQVLVRTDPQPLPPGPLGWHVDWWFSPRQHDARPRQTYFHMVHCLSTVPPGGAALMIVPGSHRLTYAASARMKTAEALQALKQDPVGVAGIDPSQGIEICAKEGDLLIFDPMALHGASANATDVTRYVYFASFFDTSARQLWDQLRQQEYRDRFPESLCTNLPEDLRPLLAW